RCWASKTSAAQRVRGLRRPMRPCRSWSSRSSPRAPRPRRPRTSLRQTRCARSSLHPVLRSRTPRGVRPGISHQEVAEMAHDSRPKTAAVRKDRKGPSKGSGGKGKRKLTGKGPAPKAEDRVYHKAHRQKQLAQRSQAKRDSAPGRPRGSGYGADDVVAGRNPVIEALRESVPAIELLIA